MEREKERKRESHINKQSVSYLQNMPGPEGLMTFYQKRR
jgi:hypothetical protein